MRCSACGSAVSQVIDSRPLKNAVRRRRKCLKCEFRFTTYEYVEGDLGSQQYSEALRSVVNFARKKYSEAKKARRDVS